MDIPIAITFSLRKLGMVGNEVTFNTANKDLSLCFPLSVFSLRIIFFLHVTDA